MKYLTTTALAALLAGTMGAMAFVPVANADDATAPAAAAAPSPTAPIEEAARGGDGGMMRRPGMMQRWDARSEMPGGMRANILDIACGDRGAEALEIAFVHMQHAVQPTATQAPLLDALKTTALADQKTFADTCKSAMSPASATAGKANLLDRLQLRLAIDTAKVTALNDVLPKFKAFYDSLTDEQKAKLEPQGGPGDRMGFNGTAGFHGGHHRPGQMQPGQMQRGNVGAPDAPLTPGDAVTPPAPDSQNTPDTQG